MKTYKAIKIDQGQGGDMTLRLPADIARAAGFRPGSNVTLKMVRNGVLIRCAPSTDAVLAQLLARFDPVLHGGEAMAFEPLGFERNL